MVRERPRERPAGRIKFLVCIDDSEECRTALRFACMRAQNTGGKVSLVYVIEPDNFNLSGSVQEIMTEEARDRARAALEECAGEVFEEFGVRPEMAVREGEKANTILTTIEDDESINILVLGAAPEGAGSNRLITYLSGQVTKRLHIPLTIVPGDLDDERLRWIT